MCFDLVMLSLITGLFHGIRVIASTEKMAGLYRGIGPTLTAIAPFMAVQQVVYDILKTRSMERSIAPSPSLFLLCGSVAGATAQTVSTYIYSSHSNTGKFSGLPFHYRLYIPLKSFVEECNCIMLQMLKERVQ